MNSEILAMKKYCFHLLTLFFYVLKKKSRIATQKEVFVVGTLGTNVISCPKDPISLSCPFFLQRLNYGIIG